MSSYRLSSPVDGVFFVQGPSVNWVIIAGTEGAVLIDTGYPGDADAVRASLREAGYAIPDLTAILLTHGHGDHLGNAAALAAEAGCPVYSDPAELPNIRRQILEQVAVPDLIPHLFRRGVLRWALHAIRAGGKSAAPVAAVSAFPDAAEARGRFGVEIVPVPLPGHTRGHTAYLLPAHDVLVAGDALVTAHPTSGLHGPQLLPSVFHGSPSGAALALARLSPVAARFVLPGHGPLVQSTPAQAAARAAEVGAAF
ncbi:MBL fold metallo-hydrolase [Microbacterium sp. Au-Mic1]|uniref:MBL fold metallo-hydrolase n=1 Tax=Microbacterium sp. Au-Mic1 TaxID=2906457 RepID=UPI001E45306A|nr:MBL fold metallo-hydrolase [Microbacterium sp. Au-Mic1]MCE4026025.1 MBL fold metallo-hydrolase [Microbacterium sp. Au-Mic1]